MPPATLSVVRRSIVITSGLLVLGVLGYVYWRTREPAPVPVVVHTIAKGRVEMIVANTRSGTVEATRRSKLAPQTGGQVAKLPVKRGDRVEPGQILVELWNDDLRAQIDLAKSEIVRARALVEQARQMAEVAESDKKRSIELRQTEIASEQGTQRLIAEAAAKKAELAAAEAALLVAQDRQRTTEAALARTILTAPFGGVVAEVNAELGEYVTPSPPGIPTLPAIDLIDTTHIRVKAPIDEVDSAAVRVGMPARITLDAYRGRVFAGRVIRIAPYVLDREKEARTVDVEVQFSDAEESKVVLPGASADVEIVVDAVDDTVRVPTEALLPGKSVLVLDATTGRLLARPLELGMGSFTFTQVKSGVQVGDHVVVSLDRAGVVAGVRATTEKTR